MSILLDSRCCPVMHSSISHYAADDFVSRRIPFTIPGNTTMANQSVEIVIVDDDMLEPIREGFRLLIVVDTDRTPLSQVNFEEQIQLGMFRINDRDDSESYLTYVTTASHVFVLLCLNFISAITFGFTVAETIIDEPAGTDDVPLSLAIKFNGTTEFDIMIRFERDMDLTTADVDTGKQCILAEFYGSAHSNTKCHHTWGDG